MDGEKTLEARLLGRDNVVLDVWYYGYAYIVYDVHVSSMMLCTCRVCIYSVCTYRYAMLCTGWYR